MSKNRIAISPFLGLILLSIMSCEKSNNPLDQIMSSDIDKIRNIAQNLEKHEVQILYTQIDRNEADEPIFTEYSYQQDDNNYFYPASTAKFPVAVLALQRLNELKAKGIDIDKDSPFKMWNHDSSSFVIEKDSSSQTNDASIAHMIKKIFLVSDNDAYNYLFDFLGRDYINKELQKRSIAPSHINHKFLYGADNKNTWPIKFYSEGEVIYDQPGLTSSVDKHKYPLNKMIKGVGYTDNDGNLFNDPFDFSEKNYLSIRSLNDMLRAVIFPESIPESQRFNLTYDDYEFLRFWMGRTALESAYPNYNDGDHYDSYVKFFLSGDSKDPMPKHIRIHNKVGMAYGTLTDVAYVRDKENGIEFMLTATVHINENGIFNDGIYEYDELGIPFLAELGRQVYNLELTKK